MIRISQFGVIRMENSGSVNIISKKGRPMAFEVVVEHPSFCSLPKRDFEVCVG
ncbi:MAG TPA: hypothetical protein VKJ47_14980 [Candidatus Binatia bacterium]|nr:hypothetical protein [Candidatus Binatia bacterium]